MLQTSVATPLPLFPDLELYIDGAWCGGSSGQVRNIVNPATEEEIGQLPLAALVDLDRAVTAAAREFPAWRDRAPAERTGILVRAAGLVRENRERLAALTTVEIGMRRADALILVDRAAEVLDWDANEGRRLYGRILPSPAGMRQAVVREAIGPVAAISPWNGSVFTPCRKIGSALSAGCTLVLKAPEEAPMSAIALVRLFEEAGVPPGVLNLVFGDPAEVSRHLTEAPEIRLISFTGSVPVGKHLAQLAGAHLKQTVMELGGHAPVIICRDANLEAAANQLLATKFMNAGQICFSPTRVLAERPVFDEFLGLVRAKTEKIVVGNGLAADVGMGPLASRRRLDAVAALIDQAVSQGAKIECGGERVGDTGFFFAPTVLSSVPDGAKLLHEEPFGPVMTVNAFDDLDEALRIANQVQYGLAGYAFTESARTADRLFRELQCGMVAINNFGVSTHGMPFGGVKDSGTGREGGIEGILSYTHAKTLTHVY